MPERHRADAERLDRAPLSGRAADEYTVTVTSDGSNANEFSIARNADGTTDLTCTD